MQADRCCVMAGQLAGALPRRDNAIVQRRVADGRRLHDTGDESDVPPVESF